LIIATFVDFDFMVIPDQITIGGIFLGIAASFFFPSLHTAALHYEGFKYSFIGFLAGALTLWLIGEIGRVAFKKEAMGMGDVKLIAALGSFLGWRAVFFTIMVASLFGAIAGMILIFSGNKKMGSKIPFGPYLAAAAVIWMIDGPQLWLAYLSFIHCNRP
jgi:leader peptidase (prepilin peptidase)/N-methyltransferase